MYIRSTYTYTHSTYYVRSTAPETGRVIVACVPATKTQVRIGERPLLDQRSRPGRQASRERRSNFEAGQAHSVLSRAPRAVSAGLPIEQRPISKASLHTYNVPSSRQKRKEKKQELIRIMNGEKGSPVTRQTQTNGQTHSNRSGKSHHAWLIKLKS